MRLPLVAAAVLGLVAACGGPSTLRGQMDQAERSGRLAEEDLDEAEKAIRALDVDKGASSLKSARARLADPHIGKYPEHQMLQDRLKRDDEKLAAAREEVKKRELERAVAEKRAQIDVSWSRVEKALESLRKENAGAEEIGETQSALKELREKLESGAALEKQDPAFAGYSDGVRKKAEKTAGEVKRSERAIAFRDGPLAARKEGMALADQAKTERDPDKKMTLTTQASEKLRACAEGGAQMIADTPELAKTKVQLDGKAVALGSITSDCSKKAEAMKKAAKQITLAQKKKPSKKKR